METKISQLPEITNIDNTTFIPVVQNIGGVTDNFKITPTNFNKDQYYYNATVKNPLSVGNYYTPATARAVVPTDNRRLGTILLYSTASGQWTNEQFIGSNVSGWATDANWLKLGIVEGDINNRIITLENRLGNSLSTDIPDLTSGNTNQWYTLGDNTYYSIPEQTTTSGVLSNLKVNIGNVGILRIKVFNISGTTATTLHQYSDINITTTGVIDVTIDDGFLIPIGSYISIYLNGVIKYNYYSNSLGIYRCDGTVASVATNLIVGANYTIKEVGEFVDYDMFNQLSSDVDIINSKVSDLVGTEEVGGLPGSQGILGSSGGDNWYYTCQGVTPIEGTLDKITVNASGGGGLLKVQAISITGTSVNILHQFEDIILISGTNTYTINDSFIVPVGSYIGVLLSTIALIRYGNSGINIVRYPIGVENEIVTASSTTSTVNFGVDYIIGTLSTFAKREEIVLKADHGYTTGLIQTLNGLSSQTVATAGSSADVQPGHMYARKVLLTSTIPNILFYSTVSATATFYQLRGTTIVNQITTSITIGANTIAVNWLAQTNDYIGIVSTFAFGYANGGGIGFYDIVISTGSYVLQPGTIPLAFYEKTSDGDGDVVKTLKEVETELLDIVGQNNVAKRKMRKLNLSGRKIILYGDSISSTDYPWYATAMSGLTSATVYNGGFSGAQTSSLATNSYIQRIYDYNPDLIVCLVGGNDTGVAGSVGTFGVFTDEPTVAQTNIANNYNGTYFIQAVDHIMRKVKDYYYNIRLRANLTGTETEAEKTAKIDALPKPYFVFCTSLAQKRNNSLDNYSQEANWLRKRNAVVEACNKNDVHCVDLYNLTGFDMSLEPYWTSPTDKVHNNGIYYMDGLHPNKYGYEVISEIVCGDLGL